MESMEYIDLRKVGREGLKEIRRQVVQLKKLGKTRKEIEEFEDFRPFGTADLYHGRYLPQNPVIYAQVTASSLCRF